ncbi:MAG: RagB/SusD family nutrient uptake outer membrane protein [Muribaculaceae bacterium]|nr:RagB/SusD family nutrient uptake outer membrane protein [Muribaculaceae bacterium]
MNKLFNKIAVAGVIAAMGMGFSSCNDELDLAPIDYPGDGSFWNTQADFTTSVYALSNMFRSNYTGNILFWAGELRAGTLNIDLINGSGALNVEYVQNIYDSSHTQFSNFGNYYGFIGNLNELIYHLENGGEEIVTQQNYDGLLGLAYGWRAFCYFQIYRMYGGVPLRLQPDVVLGITNPEELRKPRATAEETLAQIKQDIATSLEHYNAAPNYRPNSKTTYYWSKAATEMLAGEVYLWSGKVSTGDHTANAADVTTAKTYFQNVVNNYGYRLMNDYFSVWTTPYPGNTEAIFSMCYSSDDDMVQASYIQSNMLWSKASGAGTTAWSVQDATGMGIRTDGAANRFQYYSASADQTPVEYTNWQTLTPNPNRYMYYNAMYYQFDEKDLRRTMFFPMWKVKPEEEAIKFLANFDPKQHDMMGSFVLKYRPSLIDSWSRTSMVWNNDQAIYRLPLAYMYLAEIANYEGNNADVEKYINLVRARAFGSNWDEATYGYHAGSFRENENAILREKDKEFIMEGQRWWDLRRLTAVKGGSQTDHFVFQPESCPGYGLDPVANPWMVDGTGQAIPTATPVLSTSEQHKLLWPIDQTLLGSDPLLEQNPGY